MAAHVADEIDSDAPLSCGIDYGLFILSRHRTNLLNGMTPEESVPLRLTLVPAVMAIIGSRIWYHPRWFARHVPDPDIEGERLEHRLIEGELEPAGASAREG